MQNCEASIYMSEFMWLLITGTRRYLRRQDMYLWILPRCLHRTRVGRHAAEGGLTRSSMQETSLDSRSFYEQVGLLPVCNHQQLPFAFEMYAREDEEGLKLSHMFKKTFSRNVHVEFLGVWCVPFSDDPVPSPLSYFMNQSSPLSRDTVASVGIVPHYLPFIHENTGVRHLRHALALDERRVKFLPQYCVAPDPRGENILRRRLFKRKRPEHHPTLSKAYEDMINARNAANMKPDVQEVWFAGVHTGMSHFGVVFGYQPV